MQKKLKALTFHFEMEKLVIVLLLLLLILSLFTVSKAGVSQTVDHTAPGYINSLIDQENQRDTSRNHDVAVIRLEKKFKSVIFDVIIERILEKNEKNAFYVHSSFTPIPPYRIHASSFFVIFLNFENRV